MKRIVLFLLIVLGGFFQLKGQEVKYLCRESVCCFQNTFGCRFYRFEFRGNPALYNGIYTESIGGVGKATCREC